MADKLDTPPRDWATWRVRFTPALYCEVIVGGNRQSNEAGTAKDLAATGELLMNLGQAMRIIQERK